MNFQSAALIITEILKLMFSKGKGICGKTELTVGNIQTKVFKCLNISEHLIIHSHSPMRISNFLTLNLI